MPEEDVGELRGRRDALGDEIRALHMNLDKRGERMADAEREAAEAEVAAKEAEWKDLNAQVRDLETN